jgi:uncharacterized protein (DUF983 family)
MYACPHCNVWSIGLFRKWISYPTLPAHCSACGSYSHAHRSSGGVGVVVAAAVITLSGFASAAAHSAWPLVAGLVSSLLFYVWHWHRVKLEMLSPKQVAAARKTEGLGFVALVLSLFSS